MINDHSLIYIPSDLIDPGSLTPSHLLYGKGITSVLHPMIKENEIIDHNYGTKSDLRKRAKTQTYTQTFLIEYLTSHREFHKTNGNNNRQVQVGNIVLVHDDTVWINW